MQKMVFEIVESPIPGDPLAALRMQNQAPMTEQEVRACDNAYYNAMEDLVSMHDRNEDRTGTIPDSFLHALQQEIEGIFGGALGNVEFRHYRVNERGELEEI